MNDHKKQAQVRNKHSSACHQQVHYDEVRGIRVRRHNPNANISDRDRMQVRGARGAIYIWISIDFRL